MKDVIFATFGIVAPRAAVAGLWFFSDWFSAGPKSPALLIIGFLLLPVTLLWYTAVLHWFGGVWEWWHYLVMVLAVLIDIKSAF